MTDEKKGTIRIEVWGDYALFTRPEMKVERVSYDMITISAARGILEAIFWHPGLTYKIDAIQIINPIRFTNVRRNEVKSKISSSNVHQAMTGSDKELFISTSSDIQQRASLMLRDVRYIIESHFELDDNEGTEDLSKKFYPMILRRIRKGQCYHQAYLGCREFPAYFKEAEPKENYSCPEDLKGSKDLGFMFYDFDYADLENITPRFARVVLNDGYFDASVCEVIG